MSQTFRISAVKSNRTSWHRSRTFRQTRRAQTQGDINIYMSLSWLWDPFGERRRCVFSCSLHFFHRINSNYPRCRQYEIRIYRLFNWRLLHGIYLLFPFFSVVVLVALRRSSTTHTHTQRRGRRRPKTMLYLFFPLSFSLNILPFNSHVFSPHLISRSFRWLFFSFFRLQHLRPAVPTLEMNLCMEYFFPLVLQCNYSYKLWIMR